MGVRQTVWEAIYDALNGYTFSVSDSVTVTGAYIDDENASFPQVVIYPVDVEKRDFTYDRTYNTKDLTVLIDVWTKKNKDKDVIADDIDSVIDSLSIDGVMLSGFTESNALESPGDNKLHLKTITLNFIKG